MAMKQSLAITVGCVIGALATTTFAVFADGDPTTDSVPRAMPYQGILEFNGQPVNAFGADAIWIEFALYDGEDSQDPVYTQRMPVDVYSGRFTTAIGPVGDDGTPIEQIVQNADELMLGMTLLGEDPDDESDHTPLNNRQRLLASPYALWSTSAANFTVASNLTVGGNVQVNGGTVDLGGGRIDNVAAIHPNGTPTRLGGGLHIAGAELRLGLDDGLDLGALTSQRAMAHGGDDVLNINPGGDFEGGTRIDGDVVVTGNVSALGGVSSGGLGIEPNYHVSHTLQGSTVLLDQDRIARLCGDSDGCSVRIGMLYWSSDDNSAAASRSILFYYDANARRWRASNDASGQIGDTTLRHVINIFDTCYFTEGHYVDYSNRGDDGAGLKLLLWNGNGGPNRSCELTFVD